MWILVGSSLGGKIRAACKNRKIQECEAKTMRKASRKKMILLFEKSFKAMLLLSYIKLDFVLVLTGIVALEFFIGKI